MSPNQTHITTPLATLLAMLKTAGFDISTSTLIDIQKVIASLGGEYLSDFSELKSILSPLICRNKEEQEHYNTIFYEYETYIKKSVLHKPRAEEIIIRPRNYKKTIVAGIIGLILLSTIIYFRIKPASHPYLNVETISKENAGYLLTNEPVIFRAELKDTSSSKKYSVTFKIDDSVFKNIREIKKSFTQQGSEQLTAWLLNEKGDTLNTFANHNISVYCEKPPSAGIVNVATDPNNKFKKNYGVQFKNASKDSTIYIYKWYINDSLLSESPTLAGNFKSDSGYQVKVIVDTKGLHCSTDSLTATLFERPGYELSVIGAKPLNLTADINWKKIVSAALYSLLLPVSLAAMALYFKKRKKTPEQKKVTNITEPAKEYTGPYKIEFKEQEEKISPENEISQLAETMRKRHVNDLLFLNVRKTIANTIRSGGFPFLQFSPKTQPTDFLVFIDKENGEGAPVKLFEYTVKKLQSEQVNINVYSFYKEPLLLSNEKLNQSMLPVEKIARLYPNTILFIFSEVHSFFESLSTKLKPWVKDKFKSWEHKIIITPTPANDWDYKENTLLEAGYIVVPADLNAHDVIANEINDLTNSQKLQHTVIPSSYSSRFVNFDEWSQLVKYLDDNPILLQWVSALAVYPYIDWKVTVAIGKALEEKNTLKTKLVNYNNLLKLSRIKWMQTGLLSDSLRLEMLQHLDNDTEVTARNTILELLRNAEDTITASSMVADEFEMNKTVNKFLLHTRFPEQHSLSGKENARMKEYVENEWLDLPLSKYLDSANGTLLKDNDGNCISPSKYFKTADETEGERIKRDKIIRRYLAAAIVITGCYFMYSFFKNDTNYKTPQQFADITFNLGKNSIIKSFKGVRFSVFANHKNYNTETISDTSIIVKGIKVDSLQQASITISSDKNGTFEKLIALNSSRFTISVIPPRALIPLYIRYNNPDNYAAIEQQVTSTFTGYNISALQSDFSDSSRIVYYEQNQKARADSVVQIVKQNLGITVSTEFIQEIREPPAVPILFLNLNKSSCNAIAANALPASLNEIWSDGKGNRLINITPDKKLIYYSTGSKKTYGTYRIEEICLNAKGTYKVITNAGNGYQVFLIKNVQPLYYELSNCQARFKTKQEAKSIDEYSCNQFTVMKMYYENNPDVIFIPKNAKNYFSTEKKKANQLLNSISKNNITEANALIYNNNFQNNSLQHSRDFIIANSILKTKVITYNYTRAITSFKGTPFDRDYIEVQVQKDNNNTNVPEIPDCSKTFYSIKEALSVDAAVICNLNLAKQNLKNIPAEIYQFKNLQSLDIRGNEIPDDEINKLRSAFPKINLQYDAVKQTSTQSVFLTRISFDEKRYPDADAQSSLKQIVSYLNNNKDSKVLIVDFFGYKAVLLKYLQQLHYNNEQLNIELQMRARNPASQQQLQQQSSSVLKSGSADTTNLNYADVYGTGFPNDFSNQLNKKTSSKPY